MEWDDLAFTEVDQALVRAVAHRPPAVFRDQHAGIGAPALVALAQAVEHADYAYDKRGKAGCVIQVGTHVHDAGLQGRITRAGAQVPPDLAGILNHPGSLEDVDMAFIFPVTRKLLADAGAHHCVEHRQAITAQAGVLPFPERRGTTQGQQVGQEVIELVHQVDAQFIIRNTDVDVHPADQ